MHQYVGPFGLLGAAQKAVQVVQNACIAHKVDSLAGVVFHRNAQILQVHLAVKNWQAVLAAGAVDDMRHCQLVVRLVLRRRHGRAQPQLARRAVQHQRRLRSKRRNVVVQLARPAQPARARLLLVVVRHALGRTAKVQTRQASRCNPAPHRSQLGIRGRLTEHAKWFPGLDSLVGWLVWIGWFGWLVGWLVWLAGLVGWLVGWLTGRFGLLVGWLAGWFGWFGWFSWFGWFL